MRIGINLLFLIPKKVGGTETYARELIKTIIRTRKPQDTYYLFCNLENKHLFQNSQGVEVITLPIKAVIRPLRLLVEQLILPIYLLLFRIKTIFSLGYTGPWLCPSRSVVTIHDLNWHYHPEDFSWLSSKIWELTTRLSAKTANHIITDSTASQKSIVKILNIPKSKCTAILHAPPTKIILSKQEVNHRLQILNIKSPYLFSVLSGHPHKNLITLLCAFKDLTINFPKLKLIICGLSGLADQQNQKYLKQSGLTKKVKFLGFIDKKDLTAIYQNCSVFVFPSAYEGFGYPVVEAMQAEVPVVSSNAFSLKEVVGDAGILVNPYEVQSFTMAITKVLTDSKISQDLIKKGKKRVNQLKWTDTAQKTLEILYD